jgi:8-oxo-dGTP diphosphatase
MRHHHRGQFGASNIYAVCRLSPLNLDIQLDGEELEKALWMPVDEYLSREATSPFNRRVVEAALAAGPLSSIKLGDYMEAPEDYEIFMSDAFAS